MCFDLEVPNECLISCGACLKGATSFAWRFHPSFPFVALEVVPGQERSADFETSRHVVFRVHGAVNF